jgi:hypothetical protein
MPKKMKSLLELGWFEGIPPKATIRETTKGYYVLKMDEREMGGTNLNSLKAFAKKEGYLVEEVIQYRPTFKLSHTL